MERETSIQIPNPGEKPWVIVGRKPLRNGKPCVGQIDMDFNDRRISRGVHYRLRASVKSTWILMIGEFHVVFIIDYGINGS
jgi:hypothetical protein